MLDKMSLEDQIYWSKSLINSSSVETLLGGEQKLNPIPSLKPKMVQ